MAQERLHNVQDMSTLDEIISPLISPLDEHPPRVRTPSMNVVWIQLFDPRSCRYYYLNASTGETTYDKPRFVAKGQPERRTYAALTIQCAFRSHRSRKRVHDMRITRTAPSTESCNGILLTAYRRKSKLIATILTDLTKEIAIRAIPGMDTELESILAEFRASYSYLDSTFAAVNNVIEELQDQELLTSKQEEINTTLIQVQKGCARLQKFIVEKDIAFCAFDAKQINKAWQSFALIQNNCSHISSDLSLQKAFLHCEGSFRKVMGLVAFQAGIIDINKLPIKVFREWHEAVKQALMSMVELQSVAKTAMELTPKLVVKPVIIANVPTPEVVESPSPQKSPRRDNYDIAYLQESWARGIKLREQDANERKKQQDDAIKQKEKDFKCRRDAQELYREARNKYKLTIWEAVVEGWPIEKINQLIALEMKKSIQNGVSSFRVRDSQSENGRSLIQLACWWGHEHLVRFFAEKGANLGQFDSVGNCFSLLHDTARAGHACVIQVLVEFGVSINLRDSSGDLPLHWAARRNHLEAVKALLEIPPNSTDGAQVARWKSLLSQNYRGHLPGELATSYCLRKYLRDAQDKAIRGLEAHVARTGETTADIHLGALRRRRDAVIGSPKRVDSFNRTSSPLIAPKHLLQQDEIQSSKLLNKNGNHVAARRKKELRVKRTTAKAVKQLAHEGAKRGRVKLAGQKFKSNIQRRSRLSFGSLGISIEDPNLSDDCLMETPLHHIEELLFRLLMLISSVWTRRLQPSALQSLSMNEILVQRSAFPPFVLEDNGFQSYKSYFESHEHYTFDDKWEAMKYMALRTLMCECDAAKKTAMHRACVAKVLEWAEKNGNEHDETLRAPSISKLQEFKVRSTSPERTSVALPGSQSTPNLTVHDQLEHFQQRDLRTSHVHRIAELKEKGFLLTDVAHLAPCEVIKCNQTEINEMERQKAGYKYHTPDTEAEFALNEVWRQHREDEKERWAKKSEVNLALKKWSMERSRDEAELLRKQEHSRMMTHRTQYSSMSKEPQLSSNQEEGSNIDIKPGSKSLINSAPVVIKKALTGMRFRNPLPSNFKRLSNANVEATTPSKSLLSRSSSINDFRQGSPSTNTSPVKHISIDDPAKLPQFPVSYMVDMTQSNTPAPLQRAATKRKKLKGELRGAIPIQPVPKDAEFKHLHNAITSRQCPVIRGTERHGLTSSSSEGRKYHMSTLRRDELTEIEQIRLAFKRHNLAFNNEVFERAILTPEDKPLQECVKRLPTAGSKLQENPLLQQKSTLHKGKEGKEGGKKWKKLKRKTGKAKKAK
ncbi:hypothetical protein THRCLA_02974 [Thraustotheca clavata]|uniref:WW domain-containing protein n=1 Tax=Thraustotheca clavata TaxID=74557 RepID=A0A1W0A3F2_9STRA|nr:hypothetical protein THRCLA_02974 [Thraustotheca clavata]